MIGLTLLMIGMRCVRRGSYVRSLYDLSPTCSFFSDANTAPSSSLIAVLFVMQIQSLLQRRQDLSSIEYNIINIDRAIMPALTVIRHFTTKPFAGDDLQIVCIVLAAYRVIQVMSVHLFY